MKFSIVIPLFNEADNVNQLNNELIETILKIKSNQNFDFEIIYVDDGSTDNTLIKFGALYVSLFSLIK